MDDALGLYRYRVAQCTHGSGDILINFDFGATVFSDVNDAITAPKALLIDPCNSSEIRISS
jgi:hypothetical protein